MWHLAQLYSNLQRVNISPTLNLALVNFNKCLVFDAGLSRTVFWRMIKSFNAFISLINLSAISPFPHLVIYETGLSFVHLSCPVMSLTLVENPGRTV